MRRELEIIIASALVLQACAPVVSGHEGSGGSIEPKDKIFIPTPTPLPPMPTLGVFQTPIVIESPTPAPKTEAKIWPFPYFAQGDFKGYKTIDNCTWSYAGCGIMMGAMITKTDPVAYEKGFVKYWDSHHIDEKLVYSCSGSDLVRHVLYLESLGYKFTNISAGKSVAEVKDEIKRLTAGGTPVWVNTKIWDGQAWIGHHTMAVGVDKNGKIIFNDPYYGEGVHLDDSKIQEQDNLGRNLWTVEAVEVPTR